MSCSDAGWFKKVDLFLRCVSAKKYDFHMGLQIRQLTFERILRINIMYLFFIYLFFGQEKEPLRVIPLKEVHKVQECKQR